MTTTWWWVRHGPTHRKDMNGWTDVPADLSDTDRIDRLSAFLPTGVPLVSSDLIRAQATADALSGNRTRMAHIPGLREIHFGVWEGRTFQEITAEDPVRLRKFWETPGAISAPGGESWNELRDRVDKEVDALGGGGDIVAVAHLGVILTQVQRARGISAYDTLAQAIDHLSVTRISIASDGTAELDLVNHLP